MTNLQKLYRATGATRIDMDRTFHNGARQNVLTLFFGLKPIVATGSNEAFLKRNLIHQLVANNIQFDANALNFLSITGDK